MDKRTKAVREEGESELPVYRILLEQRAATDELRASTQELEAILEQLVATQPALRSLYPGNPGADAGELAGPPRKRRAEPAGDSLTKVHRVAEEELRKAREAISESLRLRLRSQRVREVLQGLPRKETEKSALSAREQQVLNLIVEGRSSKEIATALGISFKTAVTHRTSIMSKLDVHEIASVVREAILRGLV